MATNILASACDIKACLSHLAFASEMFHSRKFTPKGLIDYDQYIFQRVVSGIMPRFGPNTIGASLHFSPNIVPETPSSFQSRYPRNRRGGRRGRQGYQEEKVDIPADSPPPPPPEICYLYNYHSCQGNCGRNHICCVCRGNTMPGPAPLRRHDFT